MADETSSVFNQTADPDRALCDRLIGRAAHYDAHGHGSEADDLYDAVRLIRRSQRVEIALSLAAMVALILGFIIGVVVLGIWGRMSAP